MTFHHCGIALCFCVTFGTLPAPADLAWTDTTVSAKMDLADTSARAVFHFKNEGSTNITILDVRPSCGCTVAKTDKKEYAPNEEGTIAVLVNIGDYVGSTDKTILVRTDTTPKSEQILHVVATTPTVATVEPTRLAWDVGGTSQAKKVTVAAATGFKISMVSLVAVTQRLVQPLPK